MSIQWNKELYHYGVPRRSGRYKWGSGEDSYHHGASKPRDIKKQYKKDMASATTKAEKDAVRYKAYDAHKQYKMSKLEGKAIAKGERVEKKLLKSGADASKARAAGEAMAEKYRRKKEYDYDWSKAQGVGGGKYRAGKILLRDHEANRLSKSAYNTVSANKKYKKVYKEAKSSVSDNKSKAKLERNQAIAKGKEQLKSKSRLERKAMLAEAQANVQRQAANNANNPLRALNKSNAKYYSKKADRLNKKIEERNKKTNRGKKKLAKYR